MKKYIMIAAVLVSGMLFAQNNKPKLEAIGNMVKVTYLHENGAVQQQGFYENGELQGKWVSFDDKGNKIAVAEYNKGEKIGKWFFWNNTALTEVDYADNRVAIVKNWKQQDPIVNVE
ncbi:toxin-antitoxin system YwqK family antitoxin [Flavobacterium crassostreae]|uniref:Membrane-binding protein n=1 Tax=Flavobacterium crassostreae TaxID=1763534 RepID=A0A1B9DX95_9FLAO|nr:membrane-binding protein [Flavobacterium crassostreae]OCB74311.1 membrane-binding protein [Flavobacterium crassostreae]